MVVAAIDTIARGAREHSAWAVALSDLEVSGLGVGI